MSSHAVDLGDGNDGNGEEGSQQADRSLSLRSRGPPWSRRDSSNVNLLVRPALPGRKTHRSWYCVSGRRQEANTTEQESGGDGNGESGSSSDDRKMADLGEASSSTQRGRLRRRRTHVDETSNARSARLGVRETGTEGQDVFWEEVRSGVTNVRTFQTVVEDQEREEEDAGEGGSGVTEVPGQTVNSELLVPTGGAGDKRASSRREKNRARCLRRRQRKRWHQQQENQQSSTAEPSSSCSSSSSSEEDDLVSDGLLCAVCLDVYFCPHMCHPCNHIFCEPCLRTLAKNCPTSTPCPLCRTIITHVFFQKELNQTVRTFFPKEHLSRKQNFQKASCAKWPLPSCRKLFRMFGGFPRQWSPMARRRFPPHGGAFRVDPLELGELGELGERSPAGWRLDMDMVIIYIYSVNWIISFLILCLLCYIFFPSL
ncbi:uncharacterized protein rnf180a [Eucyclogobius newberryi]|uniref:uncharacterized protein rnf180a n=1 Tax=Eucyclogobius newberryi TaxID=166745 RepID=UPI003B5961A8